MSVSYTLCGLCLCACMPLCVCVCVCMCACVCLPVCLHDICAYRYTFIRWVCIIEWGCSLCVCVCVSVCVCVCVNVLACMCCWVCALVLSIQDCVCVYMCLCARTCVCVCVCVSARVCVWLCTLVFCTLTYKFLCVCVCARLLMEQVQKLQKQNNKLRVELDDRQADSDKLRVTLSSFLPGHLHCHVCLSVCLSVCVCHKCWRMRFKSQLSLTKEVKMAIFMVVLPGTWCEGVSARTGWPSVIGWGSKYELLLFSVSVWQHFKMCG